MLYMLNWLTSLLFDKNPDPELKIRSEVLTQLLSSLSKLEIALDNRRAFEASLYRARVQNSDNRSDEGSDKLYHCINQDRVQRERAEKKIALQKRKSPFSKDNKKKRVKTS